MINLWNSINTTKNTKSKNSKKVVNIVEKILDFNKKRKGKEIKRLTSKKMLPTLPIALALVRSGNTSQNLLHETI